MNSVLEGFKAKKLVDIHVETDYWNVSLILEKALELLPVEKDVNI